MSTSQQPIQFDPRPLTEPVDRAAVRAFTREQRAKGSARPANIVGNIVLVIVVVMFVVIAVPLVIGVIAGMLAGDVSVLPLPFIIGLGIAAVVVIGIVRSMRSGRVTSYRLNRFAEANHMSYVGRIHDPKLPGMIFHLGSSRNASDLVRGTTPRFVEFGNHSYTVKSGKNSTTYTWGYVAVRLDVPLPNIVLDAVGNNSLFGSNLPARFDRDQRLSLEGDFDQHFQLYCPAGYERDALYLFTPDIMARFIDNAAQLDAEIVDDWLFLYSRRKLSTLDPATWAWLFSVVGALMTKFDQWARWRDERLLLEQPTAAPAPDGTGGHALPFAAPAGMLTPPPGVAREGRRLKRRTNWLVIAMGIAFAVVWFWAQTR